MAGIFGIVMYLFLWLGGMIAGWLRTKENPKMGVIYHLVSIIGPGIILIEILINA